MKNCVSSAPARADRGSGSPEKNPKIKNERSTDQFSAMLDLKLYLDLILDVILEVKVHPKSHCDLLSAL